MSLPWQAETLLLSESKSATVNKEERSDEQIQSERYDVFGIGVKSQKSDETTQSPYTLYDERLTALIPNPQTTNEEPPLESSEEAYVEPVLPPITAETAQTHSTQQTQPPS